MDAQTFRRLWDTLVPIGRDPVSGGYLRYAWSAAELACREWFGAQAAERGLAVEMDGNGNLWATWAPSTVDADAAAVVTGSHFDSVPHGGAYDGALGIASAFLAIDELRARAVQPRRPVTVAAFVEEEGARFGVACLGSRLLTGALDRRRTLALRDPDGVTLADAMTKAAADPELVGPDPARLSRLHSYVELHIEQGRALANGLGQVAVASAIWPHGRWCFDFTGEGNHAGTTWLADRRDPMLTYAATVLAAREEARRVDALVTFGRVEVEPNATNAIPARVRGWLDARAPQQGDLADLVAAVTARATERAALDGTAVAVTPESVSPIVHFDPQLSERIWAALDRPVVLPTGAGHDAGVLAAHVTTAMLFVRNPTGVSHAPAEHATDEDCAAGVDALATVLRESACR